MKKIIYSMIYWSGFNYLCSFFLDKKVFIVMYHSITPDHGSAPYGYLYSHITTPASLFEQELQYLKDHGHTFVTFRDLHNLPRDIQKPTIIYFDDAWKDFLTVAYPILMKLHIPAVVFPVTGILDKTDMIWTVLYREVLVKEGKTLEEQNVIIEELKTKPESERKKITNTYPLGEYGYLFDLFMSWDDISFISKNGIEVGSHSVSHTRLDEVSNEEFENEARHSKEQIEEHTGSPVTAFSFPHARGNTKLVKKLEALGYRYAVSKGLGLNDISVNGAAIRYLKNISPKAYDSIRMFALRIYSLNLFK